LPLTHAQFVRAYFSLQKRGKWLELSDKIMSKPTKPKPQKKEPDEQTILREMRRIFSDDKITLAEVRKLNARQAALDKVKAKYGDFFDTVSKLIYSIDPQRMYSCAGHGREYDSLAAKIIPQLKNCLSAQDVHREFENAGVSLKDETLATELWELWQNHSIAGRNLKPTDL
jgi:hypothetical protein